MMYLSLDALLKVSKTISPQTSHYAKGGGVRIKGIFGIPINKSILWSN